MARALRRPRLALALPALVGLSTLVHWLAGRRLGGLWILPDEGVYAGRALAFWQHGSLPFLRGQGAGYSVLYPIVAGIPLAAGNLATGYGALKLLQALIVSLAAVPVFLYGRRLMAPCYALVAAALTVCSPLLLYSGLVMTEVLFYPLAAWTLLAIARAVATGRRRDLLLALLLIVAAVLTRTQAIVLLPVLAAAALLDAAFSRSVTRLRAFWPIWLLLALAAAVVIARPSTLGSYAVTVQGGYPIESAVELSLEHLALAILSTAVLPTAALIVLAVKAARGRESNPAVRAVVATAIAALALVSVQVGFFAARYASHLLERDLAALPPLLFVVFGGWLSQGARRPLVTTLAGAFAITVLLLLTPWNHLASIEALPDSFSLALLYRIGGNGAADLVAILVPLLLIAFVAVPRRFVPGLVAVVLAVLVTGSAVASNTIAGFVRAQQREVVGQPRNWIDRAADGNVAYFYDGEAFWNTVWQEQFWNRRITQVVSAVPSKVPGPIEQTLVHVPATGLLPLKERWVVASDPHHFTGTAVAHLAQTGLDVTGLTLWHLDGPPQLSFRVIGVQPNGDMLAPAVVKVYGCGGGHLQLTLLPKATKHLQIFLNGKIVVDQDVAGKLVWHGFIPAPQSSGPLVCNYKIVPQGLLGSTVINFIRPS